MPRRHHSSLQRIDAILSRALKKRQVPFHGEDRRLLETWQKAAGPQIAAHSRPERLKRNVLLVKVSSPVWMQQLHFLKEELIGRLNGIMEKPEVKEIRLSIGHIPAAAEAVKEGGTIVLPADLLKERDRKMMAECLETLADGELKDIIGRVMAKEIFRRRLGERRFTEDKRSCGTNEGDPLRLARPK